MRLILINCLALIALLSTSLAVAAQTVSINNGQGHGFLFRHNGQCYALLPHHVHPSNAPFSLSMPGKYEPAQGFVAFRRPDADLAVAEVTGGLVAHCSFQWARFASSSPSLGPVLVPRINFQGAPQNLEMRLDGIAWEALKADDGMVQGSYRYLSLSVIGDATIHPGTSGAFVFRDDTPLGMVVNAIPPNRARALALEEIIEPVGRWLNSRTVHNPAGSTVKAAVEGVTFQVVGFREIATAPQHEAVALEGGGTYRYSGSTTENLVEIAFPGGTTALGALIIGKPEATGSDDVTTPAILTIRPKDSRGYSPYRTVRLPANGTAVKISLPIRTEGLVLELSGAHKPAQEIEFGPITVLPYE